MANARELLKRRKSTSNTRKITRTMELVASAKMKKAQDAAEASRPYAEGLAAMVSRLAAASGEAGDHPLMERRDPKKVVLVIECSDRGLCGAFNANLIKQVVTRRQEHVDAGRSVEVISLGKKATGTLSFLGVDVAASHAGVIGETRYDQAVDIISPLMKRFEAGEIDLVEVVYQRFISPARQVAETTAVLPAGGSTDDAAAQPGGDYLYHPDPAEILAGLIPQTVRTAFFSTMLQTSAGEHAARRVAMKNATDAAGDMIKDLDLRYNRARQGKITQEIAEIAGAVEAMA